MDYGLIVDLETTGLSGENDKIIEIGLVEFVVDADRPPTIADIYGAVEDPGEPLTPEITKITGLEDYCLKNRKINWQLVQEFFDRSSVVIAHNMEFDRSFLKNRSELNLASVHWACSQKHINWQEHGFKTRALNYLAADHGFVNPFAHRAVFDCAATFKLITPYLNELIETSYEREVLFSATGAAFETKDLLKANGYRWNAGDRVWQKSVFEKKIEEERKFLSEQIYATGRGQHTEDFLQG